MYNAATISSGDAIFWGSRRYKSNKTDCTVERYAYLIGDIEISNDFLIEYDDR